MTGHERRDRLRHDPAGRRAGARLLDADRREDPHGPGARRAGRGHHRGRAFPLRRPQMPRPCGGWRSTVRRPVIAALARAAPGRHRVRRRRRCAPAARSRIHTFIATSDLHLERKLRITREACLEAADTAVRLARRYTDDVEFSAEDATRSDLDFLCRVVEAVIDAGATTVNLPDTVGYATPDEIEAFFRTIIDARAERAPRRVQHALPRRPRPGGGQQPGRRARRRPADRVHDQRHRRARRATPRSRKS